MSLQIMKIGLSTTTTTTISPTSTTLFYVVPTSLTGESITTIPATHFLLNNGTPAVHFDYNFNPFPKLYINGVLQINDTYSFSADSTPNGIDWFLNIYLSTDSDSILRGTPIVLEFLKFISSSITTITS
ncbi:hypothetical protein BM74_18425 [Bacillus thuringiensis]|uniref:DUF4183 domain-containing protein n=1 Tax=Bacillus thuringiensis TaxID=1428 RepID=A0A437SGI3_BACTU|nr:DUF4183 domain-containing protein [Bacillus thuringiensis]RVU62826.1 hypothetical protein BM74_18425 [Bacillus thuringiensis]